MLKNEKRSNVTGNSVQPCACGQNFKWQGKEPVVFLIWLLFMKMKFSAYEVHAERRSVVF
jgi:hypothetical protein